MLLAVTELDNFQGIFMAHRVTVCAGPILKEYEKNARYGKIIIIIIRLLCRCAAVPAHEAYIAHMAHPVLCTHFGFKKGIRAVSCPYPTPICVK